MRTPDFSCRRAKLHAQDLTVAHQVPKFARPQSFSPRAKNLCVCGAPPPVGANGSDDRFKLRLPSAHGAPGTAISAAPPTPALPPTDAFMWRRCTRCLTPSRRGRIARGLAQRQLQGACLVVVYTGLDCDSTMGEVRAMGACTWVHTYACTLRLHGHRILQLPFSCTPPPPQGAAGPSCKSS